MKKIYEVRGMMEWHPMFVAGRARIQVSFTGGHLGEGCVTPARYETSDAVVQRVIENSASFRKGRIRLACQENSCIGSAPESQSIHLPQNKEIPLRQQTAQGQMTSHLSADISGGEKFETFEFESLDAARSFLNFTKGVSKSKLETAADCEREARNLHFNIHIRQ